MNPNKRFKKLVAIEPVSLIPSAEKALWNFAHEVVMHNDIPANDDEIVARVGDADAVLLSYTTQFREGAMSRCPNIEYIGMCNSLYSPESANVDILYANKRGITVTGIRDYGDEGVVEYVISELVRCLHGFGTNPDGSQATPWNGMVEEITGLKCGIIGLGKSGGMIADALKFFGAKVSYFSRTRKPDQEVKGFEYKPLNELLSSCDAVFCCLNRNTVLLHDEQFKHLGNRKLLFNTGLSPAWDEKPFRSWIENDNRCYCDTLPALGYADLAKHRNVRLMDVSTGRTRQAFDRLSEKVLKNIEDFVAAEK